MTSSKRSLKALKYVPITEEIVRKNIQVTSLTVSKTNISLRIFTIMSIYLTINLFKCLDFRNREVSESTADRLHEG